MPATMNPHSPMHSGQRSHKEQLRRDRIKAVILLTIVAALTGLVFWLASISGGTPEGIDYWPTMP